MKSAVRVSVSAFGIIIALSGFQHGVGNALQGNVRPGSMFIESWPDTPAYDILSGEPAMTIVPNLLLSGIATMIVATAIAIWSIAFLRFPRSGVDLLGLSVLLLLVGGGFGPPLVGFIVGGTATRIDSRTKWLKTNVSAGTRATVASLWKYLLATGIVSWLLLWPGVVLLRIFFAIAEPLLVVGLTLSSFLLLISTLIAGFAYDSVYLLDM